MCCCTACSMCCSMFHNHWKENIVQSACCYPEEHETVPTHLERSSFWQICSSADFIPSTDVWPTLCLPQGFKNNSTLREINIFIFWINGGKRRASIYKSLFLDSIAFLIFICEVPLLNIVHVDIPMSQEESQKVMNHKHSCYTETVIIHSLL